MKNNDTLKNSLSQWQEYVQAYTDFVFDAAQQTLKASFALRERTDKLVSESIQQAQALAAQEQEIALQAAEAAQAQAQTAAQRVAKLFTIASGG
jgi:hypothetical protein